MRSSCTAEFLKTRDCPSAETLLLYGEAALTRSRRRRVAAHLAACDFCDAEARLLAHHPRSVWRALPAGEAAPAPAPLRRLAEDLLAGPSRALAFVVESALERERLTLTDA